MTPVHKKVPRYGIPKIVFHLKIKKTLKYFINFFLIRKKKSLQCQKLFGKHIEMVKIV